MSDVDVFDDAVLADPYPSFRRLRDAGPLIWMRRHHVWALHRYSEVRAALRDWQTFSSASGVGMTDEVNSRRARAPITLVEERQHLNNIIRSPARLTVRVGIR